MKLHRIGKSTIILTITLCVLYSICVCAKGFTIDPSDYASRLRAMWLGECIANWTGLQTEGDRTSPPFYTDDNWSSIGFVLNQDPWLADDDTDIEYVYMHLLNQHSLTTLTPEQIRSGWMTHINSWIWVSNARVRELFNYGIRPPSTSLLAANELAVFIDAQLTTEIFGALAPGMPAKALEMANLPILTTASSHAAHASQFHVILYSLACMIDTSMSGRDQALWLVEEARKYLPETSKVIDIVDFVIQEFLSNPDVDNWESTRDKIYDRYHLNAASNGFRYAGWTESSVNFATSIMALLYGEMNFRRTVQIGALSGWDSDNPTATLGGLLGLVLGYERLLLQFPEVSNISDRYNANRTRDALPDYLPDDSRAEDTFELLSGRMLPVIDMVVIEAGGTIQGTTWILPEFTPAKLDDNPLYEMQQRSANNRIIKEGGKITVESSVTASDIESIVDGFELDFSGSEWFGDYSEYISDVTDSVSITVYYDQNVQIHTIRLIEGFQQSGFTDIEVAVDVYGNWEDQSETMIRTVQADENIPLQIIDFILEVPVQSTGFRIQGPVSGKLNLLEVDALSEPSEFTGNIPPYVSITSPGKNETFAAPVDIEITADAVDLDGSIEKVEFYSGSEKIGEDLTSPYSFTVNQVQAGYYTFSTHAIDDKSAVSYSDPVRIFISDTTVSGGLTWHSYNTVTEGGTQPVIVKDELSSVNAILELYVSADNGGVAPGSQLNNFNAGLHPESFNKVENYWAASSGSNVYPYIGKSSVDRGNDSGEGNTPEPTGVRDLQLHPPDNNNSIVASFIAPSAGSYSVSELAVRRVYNQGNKVNYKVFDQNQNLLVSLVATNDRQWVTDINSYNLGELNAGDRIYFSVNKGSNDNYYYDATEVIWTVKSGDGTTDTKSGEEDNILPDKFSLSQNYPNPFNPSTSMEFQLPVDAEVSLDIFNIQGQKICTLEQSHFKAGYYNTQWNGKNKMHTDVASGIYIARMQANNFTFTRKLILMR